MKNIVLIFVALFFAAPLISQTDSITTAKNADPKLKLQIYYFHITNRCHTCISIENELRKCVTENYKNELETGIIRFASLNCELPENQELVKKYEAYGATLVLTKYESGKEKQTEDLTSMAFSKIGKPDIFHKELKAKIEELIK
jgi:hypothetical protein